MLLKTTVALLLNGIGTIAPAEAAEFQERAMCTASTRGAAFPRISIQREPGRANRAILILAASDGWTQVYSGPAQEDQRRLKFNEDQGTIEAEFDKQSLTAKISFNGELYRCDQRSFGN